MCIRDRKKDLLHYLGNLQKHETGEAYTSALKDIRSFAPVSYTHLAYVKKIIMDHKGTIRAESELNVGTKFIIALPLLKYGFFAKIISLVKELCFSL